MPDVVVWGKTLTEHTSPGFWDRGAIIELVCTLMRRSRNSYGFLGGCHLACPLLIWETVFVKHGRKGGNDQG